MKQPDKPDQAPKIKEPEPMEGMPLKLPHENDEDTDMTDDKPDPKMLQAYKDLKEGQVDTDMRATPGQDAAQRAKDVPGAGGQAPRQEKTSVRRK